MIQATANIPVEIDGHKANLTARVIMPKVTKPHKRLFNEAAAAFAADANIGLQGRILFWLIANADYDNEVVTLVAEIARQLGTTRTGTSLALRAMEEKGWISRTKRLNQTAIRLNENIAWSGSALTLQEKRPDMNAVRIRPIATRYTNRAACA